MPLIIYSSSATTSSPSTSPLLLSICTGEGWIAFHALFQLLAAKLAAPSKHVQTGNQCHLQNVKLELRFEALAWL